METERDEHCHFLHTHIYRGPDGSMGHKVHQKPTKYTSTLTPQDAVEECHTCWPGSQQDLWLPMTHEGQHRKEGTGWRTASPANVVRYTLNRLVERLRLGWVNSYMPSTTGKVSSAREQDQKTTLHPAPKHKNPFCQILINKLYHQGGN
ncbi:hypothetical protein Cfor_00932 [Coptotermes formosanus]|uniref:Uncharacterized protein n=1 Tax=Coptotermes formosanus TaxID=36987 RepID=A0A6L2Q603_COPFO|nr:hypothetical protein Cfor_00932 [Coptotermes formosanus]